jgi:hypothetical protein
MAEVLRLGQGDPHAISRVGAVGDEVLAVQQRDARILDAELFIGRERAVRRESEGRGIGGESNPSWLRARPMIERPVRRWERNSMMYSSPCFTTAALWTVSTG